MDFYDKWAYPVCLKMNLVDNIYIYMPIIYVSSEHIFVDQAYPDEGRGLIFLENLFQFVTTPVSWILNN